MSVVNWLAGGERGISSDSIVSHIWGLPNPRRVGHPLDPDDFKRCLMLLDASPETKARLAEMAAVSPQWKSLVENWDSLERIFVTEVGGINWPNRRMRAPLTYASMNQCFGEQD